MIGVGTSQTTVGQNEMQTHDHSEEDSKIEADFNSVKVRVRKNEAKSCNHAEVNSIQLL